MEGKKNESNGKEPNTTLPEGAGNTPKAVKEAEVDKNLERLTREPAGPLATVPQQATTAPMATREVTKGIRYETRAPASLRPHPRHREFIPFDPDSFSKLKVAIEKEGRVLVPLSILDDGTILAGHDRCDAALQLKLPEVPVQVRGDIALDDEDTALAVLLGDNLHRKVLSEALRVKLGQELLHIEQRLAKKRMSEGGKASGKTRRGERGRVRHTSQPSSKPDRSTERISKKVGLGSARAFERGRKVLAAAKEGHEVARLYEQDLVPSGLAERGIKALTKEEQNEVAAQVEDLEASKQEKRRTATKVVRERLRSKRPKPEKGKAKQDDSDPLAALEVALRQVIDAPKTLSKLDTSSSLKLTTRRKKSFQRLLDRAAKAMAAVQAWTKKS